MSNHSNTRNLGYKVTTRIISWDQRVREIEGGRWNLPIGIYFMPNGRVFVSYNQAINPDDNQNGFLKDGS